MSDSQQGKDKPRAVRKRAPRKSAVATQSANVDEMSRKISEHGATPETLKGVPDQITQILEMLKSPTMPPTEFSEEHDEFNLPDENENDAIDNLLLSNSDDGDDKMISILEESNPVQEFGPKISQRVADSISNLFERKYYKEKIEKIKSENKIPENCKAFVVPKINTELWQPLPQRLRHSDYAQQVQQQQISLASTLLSKVAEGLFSGKDQLSKSACAEMLRLTMEAQSVLGGMFQDISSKRRQDIKPSLNTEVAAICSTNINPGEWLFGDNVNELIKSTKAASTLVKSSLKVAPGKQRYTPYSRSGGKNLNWNTPPARGRWGYPKFNQRQFRGGPRRGQFQRPPHQSQ